MITGRTDPVCPHQLGIQAGDIRLHDPVLSVSVTNNQLVIQWPASAPLYALESTSNLTPPILWTPVGLSPTLSQGAFVLTLGITNAEMLFRLRSP